MAFNVNKNISRYYFNDLVSMLNYYIVILIYC